MEENIKEDLDDLTIDRDRVESIHKSRGAKIGWKRHRDSHMRGIRKRDRKEMNQSFYAIAKELKEALEDPIKQEIKDQLKNLESNKMLHDVWKASLILAADNPIKYNKWIRSNYKVSGDIFTNAVLELYYNIDYVIPEKDIEEAKEIIQNYNKLNKHNDSILQEAKIIKDDVFKLNGNIVFEYMSGGVSFTVDEETGEVSLSTILNETGHGNYKSETPIENKKQLYKELKEELGSLINSIDNELKQILAKHGLKETS